MTHIIDAVKTYIKTYGSLDSNAAVLVDFLGNTPTQYAINPLPGAKVIESYITGASLREFPFSFQSMESTADELERLSNNGFFEAFSDWLESQTLAETFPTLNANQHPILIEATSWGYLFQQGESDTGIYSIQCRLQYEQDAP